MALRHWLERRWYSGTAPLLLRPVAALYALIIRIRRFAHARGWCSSRHPGVPVVVIGNLTAGGTGKTPLVLWLVAALRNAGQRPGVVMRGFGGSVRRPRLVAGSDTAELVGDEAVLIHNRAAVPVAVGADRAAAAQLLAQHGCTVVVSDDGLQHLALRRDLQIAVVDGARGLGNGALLPAGPLREPASMLGRMDLVVMHGSNAHAVASGLVPLQMDLAPEAVVGLLTGQQRSPEFLRGRIMHAVAGIGNPQRFFALLRRLGAQPIEHAFADHHPYTCGELEFGDVHDIVMTEKDAVRCAAFATERMWYLPVTAVLPDADAQRLLCAVMAKIPRGGTTGA